MPATSAINPYQSFAATPSASSQQNNDGSGTSFGATLSDARQSAQTPAPSPSSSKDQTQQSQSQNQKSSAQDSDNSTDSATAASKAAARVAAAQNKAESAPDSNTSAWLAMLQASLGTQAQTSLPVATGTQQDQSTGTTSALDSLNAWLSAQGKTDPTQTKDDTAPLLQTLKGGTGKDGNSTADIAADDGSFLPLLQNAVTDTASNDKETDAAALAQLSATSQQHATQLANQDTSAKQTTATHQIEIPVTDNKWSEAVAQRVSMMVGKQEQQLDMQLNPPHLGPMEVRLSMAQDQASVIFTSQHAGVREALAAATPRLSALLADQGITLTNVQVASDSLNQQAQQQSAQRQFQNGQAQNGNGWQGDADTSQTTLTPVNGTIRVPVARSGLNLYI